MRKAIRNSSIRRAAIVATVLAISSFVAAPPAPAAALVAHPVVTGLADPTAFTFGSDGRIWYAQRLTGQIRIYDPSTTSDTLFATVSHVVPAGVTGLALHPSYPASPYVYVFAVRKLNGTKKDQLLRITSSGGVGGAVKVLQSVTTGADHHGGPIAFGPDGKLYLMTGDEDSLTAPQNLTNNAGKILRMNPDGTRPGDDPYAGSLVYAYGLRNSLGMAFDPVTGVLWETDNGPECNDELDRIVAKGNYGWGSHETCTTPPAAPKNTNQDGPSPILPALYSATPTAPTGVAFCQACMLGSGTNGDLFYGEYNTGVIEDVSLNAAHTKVTSHVPVYTHTEGILSVHAAPNGQIYFSDTSGIYRLATS